MPRLLEHLGSVARQRRADPLEIGRYVGRRHRRPGSGLTRFADEALEAPVAGRAGVAVGTVYRNFPSLDELLPACGELSLERLAPPDPEMAHELFLGARSRRERVERLVETTLEMYERAPNVMRAIRRDRETLALLDEAHTDIEDRLDALARTALAPFETNARRLPVVRALNRRLTRRRTYE